MESLSRDKRSTAAVGVYLGPDMDVTSPNVTQISDSVIPKVIGSGDPDAALPSSQLVLKNEACYLPTLSHTFKETDNLDAGACSHKDSHILSCLF